jgi:general secretion pathway protein F/type IV pilus assembly protein PilC
MPQFSYKARRRSGEVVTGTLDVTDRSAALMQIERLGLFPVAVDAAKGSIAVAAGQKTNRKEAFAALLPQGLREAMLKKRKPKLQELATFTQQLANLLQAGMPLTVALNSMVHLESKGIPSEVAKGLK